MDLIERLKTELEDIKNEDELHEATALVEELEQQIKGMEEFVETGRESDEVLY